MNLSIVIPLLNEEESLNELYHWIADVMQSNGFLYEILFIDDGSTDDSWEVIEKLAKQHREVKGIRFLKNFGKSQALHAGFAVAEGEVVITMDADLQDDVGVIPEMLIAYKNSAHQVYGIRKNRSKDSFFKKVPMVTSGYFFNNKYLVL